MVEFNIKVNNPLTDADRDFLAGLAVFLLAVANREQLGAAQEEPEPEPCGAPEPSENGSTAFTGRLCISPVGHKGRHRFREPAQAGMN